MHSDCSRANHLETQFITQRPGFGVEVVKHFHVIGDETDGHDDSAGGAPPVRFTQIVADIGFQPGLCRGPLRLW